MSNPLDPDQLPDEVEDNIHSTQDPADDPAQSPSLHDEEWEESTTRDDDVDEIGKEFGITYEQDEPLNIEEKVPITTPTDPPADDDDDDNNKN